MCLHILTQQVLVLVKYSFFWVFKERSQFFLVISFKERESLRKLHIKVFLFICIFYVNHSFVEIVSIKAENSSLLRCDYMSRRTDDEVKVWVANSLTRAVIVQQNQITEDARVVNWKLTRNYEVNRRAIISWMFKHISLFTHFGSKLFANILYLTIF